MSDSPLQHASHQDLLAVADPPQAFDTTVDAIVVPSARPYVYLAESARLASQLKRTLVVLCSRESRRDDVIAFIGETTPDVTVIAVDFPPAVMHPAVDFKTSEMLVGTAFHRSTDTSNKRNVGLLLAKSAGWRRIMFLDDDILIKDASDIRRAGSLLDAYAVVGLRIGGFPDNSVVCHAIRSTGGRQDTFVGAGALAVNVDATTSFFPNIYNEDWFFLLNGSELRPMTVAGKAKQRPYDPFADPFRAAQEEFGDVLAEGIFGLLDDGGKVGDADALFWHKFLLQRGKLVKKLLLCTSDVRSAAVRHRMRASLSAALTSLRQITPELCVDYVGVWQRDLQRWTDQFGSIEPGADVDVEAVLASPSFGGAWTIRHGMGPRVDRWSPPADVTEAITALAMAVEPVPEMAAAR